MVSHIRNPKLLGNDYVFAGIDSRAFNAAYAKQKQPNLCWAANIEMNAKYYGLNVSQDSFAAEHCGIDYRGNPKDCPAKVDIITKNLNRCFVTHCIHTDQLDGSPKAEDLFGLLKENRPVIAAYITGNPVNHVVTITGITYEKTIFGDIPYSVTIRDPDPALLNQLNHGKKEYSADEFLPLIYSWWIPTVRKYNNPKTVFNSSWLY